MDLFLTDNPIENAVTANNIHNTNDVYDTERLSITTGIQPLYGLEHTEKMLAEAVAFNRLPSAYLFSGLEGIGKSQLAFRLAAALLAPQETEEPGLFGDDILPAQPPLRLYYNSGSPVLTRMQQGSHPDFLWIKPPFDERKKIFKRDIPIESIRQIGNFMSLTAGEGAWKVVLIDPAEAMNNASANALLKWLEEPPPRSLFILVSHAAGKLLPTIRSRCRLLPFQPLSEQQYHMVLADKIPEKAANLLYHFTSGSPGLALQWQETGWQAYWNNILEVITLSSDQQLKAIQSIAEAMAKDERFTLSCLQRMLDFLFLQIVLSYKNNQYIAGTEHHIMHVAALHPYEKWLELWEINKQLFEDAAIFYLDKKILILNMLQPFVRLS